ncbi:MAG: ZIP family metal transporter [Thiobacillus sp.]|nr:ZIP family metal transporter [Thiobacillus sp.]
MSAAVAVILLSMMSLLSAGAGVAMAIRIGDSDRVIAGGIGFSVGIMLVISLLELIPEASVAIGVRATMMSFALGAGLVWTAHVLVPHIHLVEEHGIADRALVRSAYLIVLGLILHDLPEGFAMANAYLASPSLGVLVSVAIALHNVPEEFAMAVPALLTRSKRLLYGAALLSALAEPVGAIVGLAATGVAPALNGHFMAFAAGAMTFVSLHVLLPMARRHGHTMLFGVGLLSSALVYWALAALMPSAVL